MESRVKPTIAALQPPSEFTGASSLETNADMQVSMALIYYRDKGVSRIKLQNQKYEHSVLFSKTKHTIRSHTYCM